MSFKACVISKKGNFRLCGNYGPENMYMGIDVGSVSTNFVLINGNKQVISYIILPSSYDHKDTVETGINDICEKNRVNRNDIKKIVVTGYGLSLIHI